MLRLGSLRNVSGQYSPMEEKTTVLILVGALLGQISALAVLAFVLSKVDVQFNVRRYIALMIPAVFIVSIFTLLDRLLPQFASVLIRTMLPLALGLFLLLILLLRRSTRS